MPISLIAHTSAHSTGGGAFTSGAIDTSGANFLVVSVGYFGSVPNLTDSKSNTWTQLTAEGPDGSSGNNVLFYCSNATVGTGHTFSINTASSFAAIVIAAFSGVATSSTFESQNGSVTVAASTWQPGSVTPSNIGDLVIAGTEPGVSPTPAINSGFNVTDGVQTIGGVCYGVAMAYLIVGSTSAVNPTWTPLGATVACSTIAVFSIPLSSFAPQSLPLVGCQ